MKKLYLLLFFTLLLSVFARTVTHEDFRRYLRKYDIQIPNEHYPYRFEVFKQNLERIDRLNRRERGTAKYGLNQFTHLTPEEFRRMYLGPVHRPHEMPFAPSFDCRGGALPDKFDWQQHGAVTSVKNQLHCGSCWSFSATGNIEAVWHLAGHKLIALSEQQLVDCDYGDHGCEGGLPSKAFDYVIRVGGLMSYEDYPYIAERGECKFDNSSVVAHISSWEKVRGGDEGMAHYLYKHAPIAIGIDAGFLQYYKSGVADPEDCDAENLNHGVLLVGFGTEMSLEGEELPYFRIKNSWGTRWGEMGYFRIVRGIGACGINVMPVSSIA